MSQLQPSHRQWLNLVLLSVLLAGLLTVAPKPVAAQEYSAELVTTISGPGQTRAWMLEAIQGLAQTPHRLLLGVRNQGAVCGSGTPAAIWAATLDPVTKGLQTLEYKQLLSQTQTVQGTIFESADGTLFTGGGWCGHTPAYYSTDGGNHWQTADAGSVYPPESVYSFAEFKGQIYAGTGYAATPAQLYHWLGNGRWEHIFTSPFLWRRIMGPLYPYQGKLFIAPDLYGGPPEGGPTPVYLSTDGRTFVPTTGIPLNTSVRKFLTVNDDLLAYSWVGLNVAKMAMYHWNASAQTWELLTEYAGKMEWTVYHTWSMVAFEGALYAYGHAPSDPSWGIYRSADLGVSWQQVLPFATHEVISLASYEGSIYFGTSSDNQGKVYLYRLNISHAPANVIVNPGFESGVDGWKFRTNGQGTLSNESPGFKGVASARIDIDAPGNNVMLTQSGFTLQPTTRYLLQFVAKSNTGHDLSVYLQRDSGAFVNYGVNNFRVNLTAKWKLFKIEFTTRGFTLPTTDTRLRFWLSPFDAARDIYWFDQVSLAKVVPGAVAAAVAPGVGHVTGQVQGASAPLTATLVDLDTGGEQFQATLSTDATGAFDFAGVPQGSYELRITPPQGYLAPEPVQLAVTEEPDETLLFPLELIASTIFLPEVSR